MASPSEKLANSLEVLRKLQDNGEIVIQSKNISRTHRQRLIKNGFLQEVLKGWLIPSGQDEAAGESTTWFASFWSFCPVYLNKRFGANWCLSPEQSLSLHSGNWRVPQQLLVRSTKGTNSITPLPYNISIIDAKAAMPHIKEIEIINNLHLFSLPSALIASSPRFFSQYPTDARTALSLIKDSSEVLTLLLAGGHTVIAGRLAGAFRNIQRNHIADEIIKTMLAAGYDIRETDPFIDAPTITFSSREKSPYVNRIHILWQEMRDVVIKNFPKQPSKTATTKAYLKNVEETYVTDAYHSLSIEGYRVSGELIQRVRTGKWSPEKNAGDREHIAALAARGYWQAFKAVEKSIRHVLKGMNPGKVYEKDHRDWYCVSFLKV